MRKPYLALWLTLLASAALPAADDVPPGQRFHASFDAYSTTADMASGKSQSISFKNPDLQLRMHPGVAGKGNALKLNGSEFCSWPMPDNFNPRGGTVSLWVSPQNWRVSEKTYQIFFEARQPDFRLILYKYTDPAYLCGFLQHGKRTQAVHIRVGDSDWSTGKWHLLTLVWTESVLKLYVDGKQPPDFSPGNVHPAFPTRKITPPLELPEAAAQGVFALGNLYRGFGAKPAHETALDELRIFDRTLSDAEIKGEFERYYPSDFGAKRLPAVVTVPRCAPRPIAIDGKLEPSEWSDAVRLPLADAYQTRNHLAVSDSRMRIKSDGETIFLAFATDQKVTRQKHTAPDSAIYNDDVFEFYLDGPNREALWFAVNANGALLDARDDDRSWNSGARCAAAVAPDGSWSAELAIPLAALGNPHAGERRHANFWTLNFARSPYYYWSWCGSPELKAGANTLIFGQDAKRFSLEEISGLFRGDALVRATCDLPGTTSLTIQADDGKEFPAKDLAIRQTLPNGQYRLTAEHKSPEGATAFLYDYYFTVNSPLALTFQAWPDKRQIAVNADLNSAGEAILRLAAKKALTGEAELLAPDGKPVSRQTFLPRDVATVMLDLPGDLPAGTYRIRTTVTGETVKLTESIPFRVPDPAPYREKIADDHTVPPPWTPVVAVSPQVYRVLDREYRFNGSPFPVSLQSRGAELLASPPTLAVAGTPAQWSNFRVLESHEDFVVLGGSGQLPGIELTWRGELWFDGLYQLDWTLTPADGSAPVRDLTLTWSIPEQYGRYFLCRNYPYVSVPWRNNEISQPLNIQDAQWLTGTEKGMLWLPLTSANWVAGEKPATRLRRQNDLIAVELNLIAKPVQLKNPAQYSLALMGTPSRRPPENFRTFNMGGYLAMQYGNTQIFGTAGFRDPLREDDIRGLTGHLLRDPDAFRRTWYAQYAAKGVRLFPYLQPGGISQYDAEYDYWLPAWRRSPGYVQGNLCKDGFAFDSILCCGKGIADLMAYRSDRLFRDFPELGGVYYDICDVKSCNNTAHGHGGTDAFGNAYSSSTALSLRHYLMRIYKVAHKHGKQVFNHAHNFFNPVAHNFTDIWYPGENEYWEYSKNPEYYACEAPLDEYQAAWSPVIRGTAIVRCNQQTRILGQNKFKERRKELSAPEFASRALTSAWLHDFNSDADWISRAPVDRMWKIRAELDFDHALFHGYWTGDAVRSASPQVYGSWYELSDKAPFRRLLVIGNLGRASQPAALTLNRQQLGIADNAEFYDLQNNRALTAGELSNLQIPGNHHLLIGVR